MTLLPYCVNILNMKSTTPKHEIKWADLLTEAVTIPGTACEAFKAFHNYSVGNQIAAGMQCRMSGILPGPLKTYKGWQALGRTVKSGEKAIVLCQPKTFKPKDAAEDDIAITYFTWRAGWFALSQTDGAELTTEVNVPSWDKETALKALGISEVPFNKTNGNIQGFASSDGTVSINPLAPNKEATLFHEVAHLVLGHLTENVSDMVDSNKLSYSEAEVEAEAVALLLLDTFGLDGQAESRDYIQGYGNTITEKTAKRIFIATNKIVKAGIPSHEAGQSSE